MAIITKGMGAILKKIKTLKKSKKFPGKDASKQLRERGPRKGRDRQDIQDRIDRTKDLRDQKADQIKEFRKNKGKFTGATSNVKEIIKKSKFNKPGSKVVKKKAALRFYLNQVPRKKI